jgi:HAD superfamily hydrolase (TIGR01549 family)
MKIKWIFFDLGNTLINECFAETARITDAVNEINIVNNMSVTYKEIYNKMLKWYEQFESSPFSKIVDEYKINSKILYDRNKEILYDSAKNVLQKLKGKFQLGVIANQPIDIELKLKEFKIFDFFDLIIISEIENIQKPNVKIFKMALQRANCEPSCAVMIGDRLDNDIYPAKKIGMKTILIKQGLTYTQKSDDVYYTPDYIITDISEVPKAIEYVSKIN